MYIHISGLPGCLTDTQGSRYLMYLDQIDITMIETSAPIPRLRKRRIIRGKCVTNVSSVLVTAPRLYYTYVIEYYSNDWMCVPRSEPDRNFVIDGPTFWYLITLKLLFIRANGNTFYVLLTITVGTTSNKE